MDNQKEKVNKNAELHICKTCEKIMPEGECTAHCQETGHTKYRVYFEDIEKEIKEELKEKENE